MSEKEYLLMILGQLSAEIKNLISASDQRSGAWFKTQLAVVTRRASNQIILQRDYVQSQQGLKVAEMQGFVGKVDCAGFATQPSFPLHQAPISFMEFAQSTDFQDSRTTVLRSTLGMSNLHQDENMERFEVSHRVLDIISPLGFGDTSRSSLATCDLLLPVGSTEVCNSASNPYHVDPDHCLFRLFCSNQMGCVVKHSGIMPLDDFPFDVGPSLACPVVLTYDDSVSRIPITSPPVAETPNLDIGNSASLQLGLICGPTLSLDDLVTTVDYEEFSLVLQSMMVDGVVRTIAPPTPPALDDDFLSHPSVHSMDILDYVANKIFSGGITPRSDISILFGATVCEPHQSKASFFLWFESPTLGEPDPCQYCSLVCSGLPLVLFFPPSHDHSTSINEYCVEKHIVIQDARISILPCDRVAHTKILCNVANQHNSPTKQHSEYAWQLQSIKHQHRRSCPCKWSLTPTDCKRSVTQISLMPFSQRNNTTTEQICNVKIVEITISRFGKEIVVFKERVDVKQNGRDVKDDLNNASSRNQITFSLPRLIFQSSSSHSDPRFLSDSGVMENVGRIEEIGMALNLMTHGIISLTLQFALASDFCFWSLSAAFGLFWLSLVCSWTNMDFQNRETVVNYRANQENYYSHLIWRPMISIRTPFGYILTEIW
jgi:hypothetical protein